MSLYSRLDACERTENFAVTGAFFDWLGERLTQDDVLAELRRVLPDRTEADLLRLLGAIAWQVKQP